MTPRTLGLTQERIPYAWRITHKATVIQFHVLGLETITCECSWTVCTTETQNSSHDLSQHQPQSRTLSSFPLELHSDFPPRPAKPSPRTQRDFCFGVSSHLSCYKWLWAHGQEARSLTVLGGPLEPAFMKNKVSHKWFLVPKTQSNLPICAHYMRVMGPKVIQGNREKNEQKQRLTSVRKKVSKKERSMGRRETNKKKNKRWEREGKTE